MAGYQTDPRETLASELQTVPQKRLQAMTSGNDVQKVLRSNLLVPLGSLPPDQMAELEAGLRLVLDL